MSDFRAFTLLFVTFFGWFAGATEVDLQTVVFPKLEHVYGQRSEDYEKFLKTIADNVDVLSRLDVQVSDATKVSLSFDKNSFTMNSYDVQARTLFMGYDGCATGLKNGDYLAVQLHEYFHSVFQPNFNRRLSAAILATAGKDKERMLMLLRHEGDPDAVSAEISLVDQPFNELFADTGTVLVLKDPKALSRHFEECDGLHDTRDFTYDYPLQSWNVGRLGTMMDHRHDVFNPTRTYIWRIYSTKVAAQKDGRAILLKALFDASAQILQDLYDKGLTAGQYSAIDQEDLNRRLISGIEERLK